MAKPMKYFLCAAVLIATSFVEGAWAQQTCDTKSYAALIGETAETLKNLNRDGEKRYQERLKLLARAKGWDAGTALAKSADATDDQYFVEYNSQIEELVSKLDLLNAASEAEINCDKFA